MYTLARHSILTVLQFLHRAVEDCIASFHETLGEQLYETFDRLIPTASAQAVGTATYIFSSPLQTLQMCTNFVQKFLGRPSELRRYVSWKVVCVCVFVLNRS